MMKKHLISSFLMLIFLFVSIADVFTQECTNCQNSIVSGVSASALGYGNQALGNSSIAIGFESVVRSQGGIAIGKHLEIPSQFPYTIAIGSGYNDINKLVNTHGPSYQISFSESNMAFKSAESSNAGSTVNWNEAMVITKQGHVGIGTAEPLSEMDVNGNISVNNAIIGKIGTSKWLDPDFLTLLGSIDAQASKIMISKNNATNPVIKIMSPTEKDSKLNQVLTF